MNPGAIVWAWSTLNVASLSAGVQPWNRKTLSQAGSQARGLSFIALTGLTNNLVVQFGSAIGCMSTTMPSTATAAVSPAFVENIDGSLLVPPGGVLALLNTVSTTTVSFHGNLIWAEIPV